MRILITGANGQLGRALTGQLGDHTVTGIDLPHVDITERGAIAATITETTPDVVLHCAAFTNVDAAAKDPALALRVNGTGTQNVALACAARDIPMLYVSSNEVFDGYRDRPYNEFDTTNPINPYGYSKLAGEWYTRNLLRKFYIVRTSWLYASGGRNFIHRIQQLADEHGMLRVVTDEVANPTWVKDLAAGIVQLVQTEQYGVYHLVNEGAASRFDFAKEIMVITGRTDIPITPISMAAFNRASTPPGYAPLANTMAAAVGVKLRPWRTALADYLAQQ